MILYRASTYDCGPCPLKSKCCPKAPERRIPRSIYEEARDIARVLAKTEAFEQSRNDRKCIEMLFCAFEAHSQAWPPSASGSARRARRIHARGHRPEPTPARQADRSTATSGRRLCCVIVVSIDTNKTESPP